MNDTRRLIGPSGLIGSMICAAAIASTACSGSISDLGASEDEGGGPGGPGGPGEPGSGPGGPGSNGVGGAGGTTGGLGGSGHGGNDPGELPDGVPLSTRIARLTHEQYDNTASDLLTIPVAAGTGFLGDPTFAGYDNSAEGLAVTGRLGRDYRRTAEELSAAVVSDPEAYARIVPCDTAAVGCAEEFVETFGRRAYRRPLTDDERQAYLTLHAAGADLVASGDAFRDGVRVAVEAFLQSPHFLYRVELSHDVDAEGFVPLSGYEIASRLSFMLWNTMPDEPLFEAAANGSLSTDAGIAEQAARMLEMAPARRVVEDFHDQWLELDRYRDLTKSTTLYPEFASDLGEPLRQEALRFIEHVVFDRDQGLHALLRAPYTFVNRDLAPLYGLSGSFDDSFVRVDLDASRRGGFLTQVGFLASHAYSTGTSPIHRGVFVLRRILCFPLPDPPPDVDFTLPPIEGDIRTTRQQITAKTEPDQCASCHSVINPVGFGFEHYDAIGKWRDTENGEPIDPSGTVEIDGQARSFANGSELLDAIAASEDARACYARNWLRYAYGREDRTSDAATLGSLAVSMADPTFSVKDLLLELTQTKAFRLRATNTVEP